MIWELWIGAVAIGGIGIAMTAEGKNLPTRMMGAAVTLLAGGMLFIASGIPGVMGYVQLDNEKCSLYTYSIERARWECVPAEQGG